MSIEWSEKRPQRAKRRIEEARAQYGGHLVEHYVLHDALHEFIGIGDVATETHARELAEVLGTLRTDEYQDLLRQALEHLQQVCSQAVWEAERQLQEGIARRAAKADGIDTGVVTLEEIRLQGERDAGFVNVALVLQALTWAVAPPREHRGIIA